jgi:amidase
MTRYSSALEVAEAIRTRKVSPTEVMQDYLARVDRLDPTLNAFALRDDDRALADAAAATELVASTPAEQLPPFLGVPIPIKDLNRVEGWPTTFGSRGVPETPETSDDPPVARLRGAGFVLMGKTTTPEFGTISMTESERLGATRNPWNPDHTPGGSSGGAGAAVASGMAPIAHASDGGGSIRIPASCNGLVGLKPSRNRITNRVEVMTSASTSGVVTRTMADTAAVLQVASELDRGAWNVAPPHHRSFVDELDEEPGRLRIMVTPNNALGVDPAPECVEAVRATATMLSDLGHDVVEADPYWPDPGQFLTGFLTVWATIAASVPNLDIEAVEPHNRSNWDLAMATNAIDFTRALIMLQEASRGFLAQFDHELDGGIDVLVTPTMAVEPPEVGSIWAGVEDDPGAPLVNATPMAAYTAIYNVTGQPALSLPLHVAASGLPVGVQFAAGPWDEAVLLRLGAQLERAHPWVDRWPALAD